MALDQAGHGLPMSEAVKLLDLTFGIQMLATMVELAEASRSAAQDELQRE